jgi:hypothetical protein
MKNLIESFEILKKLPIARAKIIEKESDLEFIPFPYFMKVSIPEHKTEKKALIKCNNISESKTSFSCLRKKFPNEKIVIQEEIDGVEMIIGLKKDPVFDKILLIGFGGISVETLKDIQFRVIPVSKDEIKKALEGLKLYPSLFKRKKYAIDKFIDLAYIVSKLDLKELDLNPVILTEKSAIIVDARLEN